MPRDLMGGLHPPSRQCRIRGNRYEPSLFVVLRKGNFVNVVVILIRERMRINGNLSCEPIRAFARHAPCENPIGATLRRGMPVATACSTTSPKRVSAEFSQG